MGTLDWASTGSVDRWGRRNRRVYTTRPAGKPFEPIAFHGKRAAWFVQALKEAVRERGVLDDQAKIEAAQSTWATPADEGKLLAKANRLLKRPDIKEAFSELMEQETGFSKGEGLELWVDHIKGRITKQVMGNEGEVVDVAIPPNYAALKDYMKMVLPEAPRKLEVRSQSLVLRRDITGGEAAHAGPPPMLARAIGEAYEPSEQPDSQEADDAEQDLQDLSE